MWHSKTHVSLVLKELRQILVFANQGWPWVTEVRKSKTALKEGTALCLSPRVMEEHLFWQSWSLRTAVLVCRLLSRTLLLCITLGGEQKVTVRTATDSWHHWPSRWHHHKLTPFYCLGSLCMHIMGFDQLCPYSLLCCSFLTSLWFFSTMCSFFSKTHLVHLVSLCVHGFGAIYWSMSSLWRVRAPKKTNYFS